MEPRERRPQYSGAASLLPVLLVAAALCAYGLFGLAWISLPGLEHDEVIFLNAAFPKNPVTWYVGKLQIWGRDIPTMLLPYLGALKGLLWRGVFFLWAPSVYSVRVPAVILGGIALALFYLWARKFYSPGTALPALALAAADPTYIFTARLDWGPVALAHVLRFAGLLLGARWLHGGRLVSLAAAGFCFGLGLWDKATFIWFLLALGVALAVLFPRQVIARLRPAALALFLFGFAIGALPLILYNLRGGDSGTRQAARLETLDGTAWSQKLGNLQTSLDGRFAYGWIGGEAADPGKVSGRGKFLLQSLAKLAPPDGSLLPWALAAALAVAAFAAGARRAIVFPLLVTLLMWAQMLPLKNAGGGAHHFSLAYPLPHLAVAASAAWLWSRARRWARPAVAVAVLAVFLSQIGWDARYLVAIHQTGGLWNWTDATYRIASYLNERPPDLLVNMDWGFTYPLLLLTHPQVRQQDFYSTVAFGDPRDEPAQVRELVSLLTRPNTLFLFHGEAFENFPAVRKVFDRALAAAGMRPRIVRTFYQRTGDPVAMLVAVEPGPGDVGATYGAPVQVSFAPSEVSPGGRYQISCPALAGRTIDVKYVFRDEPARISLRFCRLDSAGTATIRVPAPFQPGTVRVIAVRLNGTLEWRPTNARITVR